MHGVAAVLARNRDQPRAVEIRGWPGDAEPNRSVGRAHVRRMGIVVGVDSDARDPQFSQRAHDAQCDLAAVRDKDLLE